MFFFCYLEFSDSDSELDPFETSDSLNDPTYVASDTEYDLETKTDHYESSKNSNSDEEFLVPDRNNTHLNSTVNDSTNIASVSPNSPINNQQEISIVTENNANQNELWIHPVGRHLVFDFEAESGITPEYAAALQEASPLDFWSVFVDNKILDEMVNQTNLYATQTLLDTEDIASSSRLHKWSPTTRCEMKKFLGIICYMGLVKMPSIRHYWSKKPLFQINGISQAMSRNRFELLLKMWHFSNNDECPEGDRLYKIQPLLDMIIENCQKLYTPGRVFCIDETLIPFRGRLLMKQYIPQKTHKYGIKMFKLCCNRGYTWNMKLYAGKEADRGVSVPTKIVTTLSEKLLNCGRIAITDNYYTSLELANILLDQRTHLIGTLRANRRGNPKEVVQKKLKKGEVIGRENNRGICIMKWRDKRDVLMLSTKNTHETREVSRRNETIQKPIAILEYNSGKSSIDVSDQMASYNSALRRTIKWYRKIAIEVLLGTTMVNAHFLYKLVTGDNKSITEFRERVLEDLLCTDVEEEPDIQHQNKRKRKNTHTFAKKEGLAAKTRKYCRRCYQNKEQNNMTKNKVRKVTTYCLDCDGEPHYCLECFNEVHK